MPKITFTEPDGTTHIVDAAPGQSVMQTAVDNLVPGIFGDCGGCCSCATCHAHIDSAWLDRLPAPSEDETLMLEGSVEVNPNSRLCCQLNVSDAIDGLVVHLVLDGA